MLHPALRQLLASQTAAKWRRLRRAFSSRRRCMLSLVATALAAVWCGNILLSVLMRESAPPARFAQMVSTGLFVYALWHVLKPAFKRPEEALEWTAAERELLGAGPFRRSELIFYRLTHILNATLVKAVCFTLLMLPDLHRPLAGLVGIFLGLIFLDLLRINLEITTHGLAQATYRRFRLAIAAISASTVASSLVIAYCIPPHWHARSTHLTWAILKHVLRSASMLLDTIPGRIALAPFKLYSSVIVTEELSASWLFECSICCLLIPTMTWLAVYLDGWFDRRIAQRERDEYPPRPSAGRVSAALGNRAARQRIAWLLGAGPLAWRQLIGADKQRSQLAVALALPGLLAMLPVFVCSDGRQAALQVSAALTFYSFLLLPTALKFDFRRDIQRMVILKTLPIRPVALVVGQIGAPSILAFVFQVTVLVLTMLMRPFPIWILLATLLLLAPLNALIFALDNLLYLLYPYRLNQEGIEIFLRTTLTFTAKGLIFTAGLLLTFFWSFVAHEIARHLPSLAHDPALVFVMGGWVMLCGAVLASVQLLARIYTRFDPSQDTPA
jgi:hypothetical protein